MESVREFIFRTIIWLYPAMHSQSIVKTKKVRAGEKKNNVIAVISDITKPALRGWGDEKVNFCFYYVSICC
jgi:hypothetical protein